jgi:hypothetical protein
LAVNCQSLLVKLCEFKQIKLLICGVNIAILYLGGGQISDNVERHSW